MSGGLAQAATRIARMQKVVGEGGRPKLLHSATSNDALIAAGCGGGGGGRSGPVDGGRSQRDELMLPRAATLKKHGATTGKLEGLPHRWPTPSERGAAKKLRTSE